MRYTEEMITALRNEVFVATTAADALLEKYQKLAGHYWHDRLLVFFDVREFGDDCDLVIGDKTYTVVGINPPDGISPKLLMMVFARSARKLLINWLMNWSPVGVKELSMKSTTVAHIRALTTNQGGLDQS